MLRRPSNAKRVWLEAIRILDRRRGAHGTLRTWKVIVQRGHCDAAAAEEILLTASAFDLTCGSQAEEVLSTSRRPWSRHRPTLTPQLFQLSQKTPEKWRLLLSKV